jgi:4-hydroxybenzoate polyprenyltransferase
VSGETFVLSGERSRVPASIAQLLRTLRVIHPFPTLVNVAATAGLSVVVVAGWPDAWVLARMMVLMFCAQSAIGIVNDYFDRRLDAATKPWKPVASGLISARAALFVASILILSTAAIGLSFGLSSLSLAMVGLASGLAYDVWLKRSIFSPFPYMLGITTLPLWVWVTLGEWDAALWWLLPLGSLVGFALHLANTVPDIESDMAAGVRGFAHRLGAQRSLYAGWASFGVALVLSGLLIGVLDYDLRLYVPALAAGIACLSASVALYAWRRDVGALQFGFGALGVGSAILAAGWLAAVG